MIKIQMIGKPSVMGALVAMRMPFKGRDKVDSTFDEDGIIVGNKDIDLAQRLSNAGTDHRKFLRLATCHVLIEAPLYWWKQFDTYRFGVEKCSESTMHTIMKRPIQLEDFAFETEAGSYDRVFLQNTIDQLERYRDAGEFEKVVKMLPDSYIQGRVCMISFEALLNMYKARKHHKLKEWHDMCAWIENVPHFKELTGI